MELRHANNLAEAVQAINTMLADSLLAAMSSEFAVEDSAKQSDISPSDARRGFRNVYFLNSYESAWKVHERGIIDDEMFSVYLGAACGDLFGNRSFDEFMGINGATWSEASSVFNPRFIQQVEQACTGVFDAAE